MSKDKYNIPNDLCYTRDHLWVLVEDGTATVGFTDYAQFELGDVTGIELPEEGTVVEQGDECGAVESVKTETTVYTPLSGRILEVNADLEDDPGSINSDPYVDGWVFKMSLSNEAENEELLSAEDYEALLADEE